MSFHGWIEIRRRGLSNVWTIVADVCLRSDNRLFMTTVTVSIPEPGRNE